MGYGRAMHKDGRKPPWRPPIMGRHGGFSITPACAGKTRRPAWQAGVPRNHPRMRREDCDVEFTLPSQMKSPPRAGKIDLRTYRDVYHTESPPHARGRLPIDEPLVKEIGITPACAGKTSLARLLSTEGPESPPRARGRPPVECAVPAVRGITPACAGKTRGRSGGQCGGRNHPRVRGEDSSAAVRCCSMKESPPRARGRRHHDVAAAGADGITPACAGKTEWVRCPVLLRGNHPRVRGEDSGRPDAVAR